MRKSGSQDREEADKVGWWQLRQESIKLVISHISASKNPEEPGQRYDMDLTQTVTGECDKAGVYGTVRMDATEE